MAHFIALLTLILGVTPSFAGYLPGNNNMGSLGHTRNSTTQSPLNLPLSALNSAIPLFAGDTDCTTTGFYGFQSGASTSTITYQVPSGSTLHCLSVSAAEGTAGSLQTLFGHAGAIFTDETTTAPVGVMYYNNSKTAASAAQRWETAGGQLPESRAMHLVFPEGRWPFVRVMCPDASDWNMNLECYLLGN